MCANYSRVLVFLVKFFGQMQVCRHTRAIIFEADGFHCVLLFGSKTIPPADERYSLPHGKRPTFAAPLTIFYLHDSEL